MRLEGSSHDNYGDGRTDLILQLAFWNETTSTSWQPSAFASPRTTTILGHCVTLVEGSTDQAVLDVSPARGEAARTSPPIVTCKAPTTPPLTDLGAVEDGGRYHAVVRRDADHGNWLPVESPTMPMHHASRLAWSNLTAFPQLSANVEHLRFDFTLERHHVEQDPQRHTWFAEYFATVDGVCRP